MKDNFFPKKVNDPFPLPHLKIRFNKFSEYVGRGLTRTLIFFIIHYELRLW